MNPRPAAAIVSICIALAGCAAQQRVLTEGELMQGLSPAEVGEYCGLRCFLTNEESLEYLSLATQAERAAWIDRYWIRRDPTPATEENEAREEHAQRVAIAKRLFGLNRAPGWDDRGEMVIRFGLPDGRTTEMADVTTTGLSLPTETWFYGRLEMTIVFKDVDLRGHYFCDVAERLKVIPGNVPLWSRKTPFEPPNMDYIADKDNRMRNTEWVISCVYEIRSLVEGFELEAERRQRMTADKYGSLYTCEVDPDPLPLFFDIASFRAGEKMCRTDIGFEAFAKDVVWKRQDGAGCTDVRLDVLVRDENLRIVARGSDRMEFESPAGPDAMPFLVPGQITLALAPGRYAIGIEAHDAHSGRRAAYRTEAVIEAFDASPSLSDIQLASGIRETQENVRFMHGPLRVVPHPLRAYRVQSPIAFYFEVYGLSTDVEDRAFYRIAYELVPLEKKRWGPVLVDADGTVRSEFETSGYGPLQTQHLSIATENLWKGPYRLDVTVTDRRTLKSVTRSANLSLLE